MSAPVIKKPRAKKADAPVTRQQKLIKRINLLSAKLNRNPTLDAEEVYHAHKLLEDIEDRIIAYERGLSWIAKTCRAEIPLGYSERMRVVLLRHLAERAERAMK